VKITFVLPGRNRTGGVRATVDMANALRDRGHAVRIACRRPDSPTWKQRLKGMVRERGKNGRPDTNGDWVQNLRGLAEDFDKLDELQFSAGEVVIAVGSFTIDDVRALKGDVVKVRYCHGFQEHDKPMMERVWGGQDLPTLAVANTLTGRLLGYGGLTPLAIVPNGIHTADYFIEERQRDGIGTIYATHFNKGPEFTRDVLRQSREKWPGVRLNVFGFEGRPAEMDVADYTQLPDVTVSRSLYNKSQVWLVCSRHDFFCLPILEAMACGCVVISTRNLGAMELIEDGKNGFLKEFEDVEGFLGIIARVREDAALRRRVVEAGQETVRRHTWEAAAQKMETVLMEISGATQGAGR